ncbi:MAG: ATP-grasp domain-containing protein [Pseudomonadota bacterium]|nr:ATP-grasp domain-containing protein [Pseudomonadota bacterium]
MDVVFLSPAYPPEMAAFTRGLAEVGARVFGVGDSAPDSLPQALRGHLTDYVHVPRIMDDADVIARVGRWLGGRRPDRIETNWEPLTVLAARMRAALGVPGLSEDVVLGFRDKPLMRERVAQAGLRVPRSARVRTRGEAWEAAAAIGFPLIVKPVAGAGSADTFRVDSESALDGVLDQVRHVPEISVEEFIEGEEYTYETLCVDGAPVYESVCQYFPNALVARQNEWISPIIQSVRHLDDPRVRDGVTLGRSVLSALRMGTGFTHMEWFRTPSGEAIFGEVACRAPGANMVDLMNYTSDVDLFREWARVVCHGVCAAPRERPWSAAIVFKRAEGHGRITHVEGVDAFRRRHGSAIVREELLPIGAPRRDWKQTFLSDGNVVVRHRDGAEALRIAMDAASSIRLYAR